MPLYLNGEYYTYDTAGEHSPVLKGELPRDSVYAGAKFYGKGVPAWQASLESVVAQPDAWHPSERESWSRHIEELAAFLNAEIAGPYYVDSESGGMSRRFIGITFFEPEDCKRFMERYPEWKLKPHAIKDNNNSLKVWEKAGVPVDERLKPYAVDYSSYLDYVPTPQEW